MADSDRSSDRYIRMLASEHAHERQEAVAWLGAHPAESLSALRELVRTGRPRTAAASAIRLLGRLGGEPDVDVLRRLLTHDDSSFVWAAAEGLADNVLPGAEDVLLSALNADRDETAGAAAVALGTHGCEVARARLESLLKHPSETVRYRAVFALGRLGAAPSVPALRESRRVEQSPDVRRLLDEVLA